MAEKKFLDLEGLKHYNSKIKAGSVRVGHAEVAERVAASGIQWGTTQIPLANIPRAAMERCMVVANDVARFALTADQVQNGDTVKVTLNGKMYFVKDDTKLNSEAGYEPYVTGTASVAEVAESVEWDKVKNKPSKFAPENHGTNIVTALTGYVPTLDSENTFNELSDSDTLNAALNKLYKNDYRMLPIIDIEELDYSPGTGLDAVRKLAGTQAVIRYTLTYTNGENKTYAVGTLEQFTDNATLAITQIAETRCILDGTKSFRFKESQGAQRYIRHYILKDGNPLGAKNTWTAWKPYCGEETQKLIDAAKQEGTDAKTIATDAKNELAGFRRITESEIDALL